MKTLTILLLALSFNATADRVSQPKLEARCYSWAFNSGMDESISDLHLKLAMAVLSNVEVAYEVGFAEGFLVSYDKGNTTASERKAAYQIYTTNCAKSI